MLFHSTSRERVSSSCTLWKDNASERHVCRVASRYEERGPGGGRGVCGGGGFGGSGAERNHTEMGLVGGLIQEKTM